MTNSSGQAGPSSGYQHSHYQYSNSLFGFLQKTRTDSPIYLLTILNFIGKLALRDSKDSMFLELLRANKDQFADWVWAFIHRVGQDQMVIERAQSKYNIQLVGLQEHTIRQYREILELADDGQQIYTTNDDPGFRAEQQVIPLQYQHYQK